MCEHVHVHQSLGSYASAHASVLPGGTGARGVPLPGVKMHLANGEEWAEISA